MKSICYNFCMAILEIKNLNLGFNLEEGFYQALYDVSFSLEKGNTLALVGESGCGKSMTAMSILNLLPQNAKIMSGEIIFDGKSLFGLSEQEYRAIRGKRIALIPQDPMTSLNPLYTVGDQLLEVIKIHQKLSGKEALNIAIDAFDAVQIPSAKERLKAYPHEFSGGMKQRAIIAMALACNAEILIADEPTTALDVTIQAQIMNLINEVKKERNTSVILITHDLALVKENSDDICVMYCGQIVEQAPTGEFFKEPMHPYSKALLKSIPSIRGRTLDAIKGQPPTIMQIISGCKFHPRCPECFDKCCEIVPELLNYSDSRLCACHLYSNK